MVRGIKLKWIARAIGLACILLALRMVVTNAVARSEPPEAAERGLEKATQWQSIENAQSSPDDEDEAKAFQTVLVAVISAPFNFARRTAIRETWAKRIPDGVEVKFFTGETRHRNVARKVRSEQRLHGDVVVLDFVDHYNNLTLKTVGAAHWAAENPESFHQLVKVDDDAYVFLARLLMTISDHPDSHYACSQLLRDIPVVRDPSHRWFTSTKMWPAERYPTYCTGVLYVLSRPAYTILGNLYKKLRDQDGDVFRSEDAHTGVVLSKHGITPSLLGPSGCRFGTPRDFQVEGGCLEGSGGFLTAYDPLSSYCYVYDHGHVQDFGAAYREVYRSMHWDRDVHTHAQLQEFRSTHVQLRRYFADSDERKQRKQRKRNEVPRHFFPFSATMGEAAMAHDDHCDTLAVVSPFAQDKQPWIASKRLVCAGARYVHRSYVSRAEALAVTQRQGSAPAAGGGSSASGHTYEATFLRGNFMDSRWLFSSAVQFQLAPNDGADGGEGGDDDKKNGWVVEFVVESDSFVDRRADKGAGVVARVASFPADREAFESGVWAAARAAAEEGAGEGAASAVDVDAVYTLLRCDSDAVRGLVRRSVRQTLRFMGAWLRQVLVLTDSDCSEAQALEKLELAAAELPLRSDGSRLKLRVVDVRQLLPPPAKEIAHANAHGHGLRQHGCVTAAAAEAALTVLARPYCTGQRRDGQRQRRGGGGSEIPVLSELSLLMRRGGVVAVPMRTLSLEDFYDRCDDAAKAIFMSEASDEDVEGYCNRNAVGCKWLGSSAVAETYLGRWFAHSLFSPGTTSCPSQVADFAAMTLRTEQMCSAAILFPKVVASELQSGGGERQFPPPLTAELVLTLGILQKKTKPSDLKGQWKKASSEMSTTADLAFLY